MTVKRLVATVAVAAAVILGPNPSQAGDGEAAVRDVLMSTFDKPETRLVVDPVIIERDVAIASWTQGETGGRALLRLRNGSWSIVLCGGDGLKEAAAFEAFGFGQAEAATFASRIAKAESSVPEERRAMFSRFGTTVRMDH